MTASCEDIFRDLVERSGGVDSLSPFQIEVASTIASLLSGELRAGDPNAASTVAKLLPYLPQPKRKFDPALRITKSMSLQQAARAYALAIRDAEPLSDDERAEFDGYVDVLPTLNADCGATPPDAPQDALGSPLLRETGDAAIPVVDDGSSSTVVHYRRRRQLIP